MSIPIVTDADIQRWFSAYELDEAQPYLYAVTRMKIKTNTVSAYVLGSTPRPYFVEVEFNLDKAGLLAISPRCSCSVGWHCKHTAATTLAYLAQQKKPTPLDPELIAWLEDVRQVETKKILPKKLNKKPESLFYCLAPVPLLGLRIRFLKARLNQNGDLIKYEDWHNIERAVTHPPSFVNDDDMAILPLLWAMRDKQVHSDNFLLHGDKGEIALERMLASERLFYIENKPIQLHAGEIRSASMQWQTDAQRRTNAKLMATPAASQILCLKQLWYLDADTAEIGVLESNYPIDHVKRLLELPPLSAHDLPRVASSLLELSPELSIPLEVAEIRHVDTAPVPQLEFDSLSTFGLNHYRNYTYSYTNIIFDYAVPTFSYDEFNFSVDDKNEYAYTKSGETVRVTRDFKQEAIYLKQLEDVGLLPVPINTFINRNPLPAGMLGLDNELDWPPFMSDEVAVLQRNGWKFKIPADFRHYALEAESWEAEFKEDGNDWLEFDLGVVVEGKRLALAPILHDLFHRDSRWLDAVKLKNIADKERITLLSNDGMRFVTHAERIKPLARTLIDLFDAGPADTLRVSRLDAPRLAAIVNENNWQFKGDDAVIALAERLQQQGSVKTIASPKGLQLELRPYQQEGLAWLQYLREHNLAGILADDMGLGKTAQALAHLLLEKEAGRLDRPALIVLPTSLIFNWKREAERFAPDLRVLSLHGKDRVSRFPLMTEHDVALTTYALLWRDHALLAQQKWHYLILDEAQMVKNAGSRAAKIAREIEARHRLCITGTPMENHLGELWAQFDFLLPGFLSNEKQFAKTFRNPIEKNGDNLRTSILAKRVAPFILRRRKEDVAKELPPKTIIVRSVELVGGQRDLYETVRSAMDSKVVEAISQKGFARSQIVILDALLKLRQVCCDPRLIKSAGARSVKERAKLDLLMDMVPELLDEGRKVLIFSQFTSMLTLIAEELNALKIKFVMLTGDTNNREEVIKRFQDGEVTVFLISLKAGGVGLNLTTADTVIHYDPWWNPAVENQATDRAHRIGQEKHVFVYKLVVAGSIEEKILLLQEKKAELAASVLTEDNAALSKFGESDIRALLTPLPDNNERIRK
jgi:superfamily II DNA or RNA helicase